MGNVTLTAIIKAWPEHTETLKKILLELVEGSRSESTCIQYDLHQVVTEPNIFIFHEIWESDQALETHNSTAHLQKFIAASAPLLLEPATIHITNKLRLKSRNFYNCGIFNL